MKRPIVSFVIPVLNGERYIARCLSSIRSLHFPKDAYEVIVLDNGSTDRTLQVVRELGFDCHTVPRVHVSALRNRGVAMARGTYVAFVDADVEVAPDWLQHGLAALQEQQVVACGCFPRVPPEATWVQRTWDIHQCGKSQNSAPYPVAWLPSMNLIVRRDEFLAIGGFNEQLETTEDVDLCYRLGQRGTVLCNPAMKAIHWGEARDLRTFWRKEVWRGMGGLRGVLSHGLRWDEIPSLGYPLYVLCCSLLTTLSIFVALWSRHVWLLPVSLALLGLPALLLALNTARLAKRPGSLLKLFLLYVLYGFARAYAVVKI